MIPECVYIVRVTLVLEVHVSEEGQQLNTLPRSEVGWARQSCADAITRYEFDIRNREEKKDAQLANISVEPLFVDRIVVWWGRETMCDKAF